MILKPGTIFTWLGQIGTWLVVENNGGVYKLIHLQNGFFLSYWSPEERTINQYVKILCD